MAANPVLSIQYWERRAAEYATRGNGLAAVCSDGMPAFYNTCIDWTQRLALRRWTRVPPGVEVLDIGCGVGRWSVALAARGAHVTGVDLSKIMLAEAWRRAAEMGVAHRCQFVQQDLATLSFDTDRRYWLILGVTVLQHILDPARLDAAVANLAAHLHPHGRLVLLEVAPTRPNSRCDTPAFQSRHLDLYLDLFRAHGLQVETLTGVDPTPLRIMLLPHYRRFPRFLSTALLLTATALCFAVDAIVGRRLTKRSWHKVFVLRRAEGSVPRTVKP